MKYKNKWVMHYARYRKNGNGTSEHQIIEANSFEEAKEKINEFCDMMNHKYPEEQYKACNTGYQMPVGGGCKW